MSRFWKFTPVIAVATAVTLLCSRTLPCRCMLVTGTRVQKIDDSRVEARILASTVTAAMAFNDRKAAQEYVDAFGVNPDLLPVAIYDTGGALFLNVNQHRTRTLHWTKLLPSYQRVEVD